MTSLVGLYTIHEISSNFHKNWFGTYCR